jgi:hypothetical protein
MKALLRYVMIKSVREKHLLALLIGPALLILAPVGGFMLRALVTGNPIYPFVFDANLSAEKSRAVLADVAVVISAFGTGAATFWIFRKEIADRSVASLVLASRPLLLVVTAIAYGVTIGFAACLVALGTISITTLSMPQTLLRVLFPAFIAIVIASVVGVAAASIQPEPGMFFVMGIVVVICTMFTLRTPGAWIAAAVSTIVLPVIASFLLERRCAA